jgi:hypothetical protein
MVFYMMAVEGSEVPAAPAVVGRLDQVPGLNAVQIAISRRMHQTYIK